MKNKETISYLILTAGIAFIMLFAFRMSGYRENVSVVQADEETGSMTGETASASDAEGTDSTQNSGTNSNSNTNNNNGVTPAVTPNAAADSAAAALSAEEIAKLTSDYSDAVKEKNELQTKLNSIMDSQNGFIATLNDLDDLIIEYQDKIDQLEKSISDATSLQIDLGQDLEKAQMRQDAQYELLKAHICDEYENGTYTYLDALFDATDYTDIVNRNEYIKAIEAFDERMLQNYVEARQLLTDKSAVLSTVASDQLILEEAYRYEQDNLQMLSDAKERQINSYQNNINALQREVDAIEAKMNAYIAQIEASYNVQYNSNGTTNGSTSGGGQVVYNGEDFLWPMPTSHTISSYYGPRVAPTEGATSYHRGIDISCPMSSEVVAAAAGTVIYTGYLGNGGNCVIVDHGGGLSTCYFHLSGFLVNVGDNVAAGQAIALSGNTGVSTGPHLHFAVRENGEYVNPLKYFKDIEDQSQVANTEGE